MIKKRRESALNIIFLFFFQFPISFSLYTVPRLQTLPRYHQSLRPWKNTNISTEVPCHAVDKINFLATFWKVLLEQSCRNMGQNSLCQPRAAQFGIGRAE